VKVQGEVFGSSPLLIYDENKSFHISVDHMTSLGCHIANFTKSIPSIQGRPHKPSMKCYLYARTEGAGLQVYLDKLAPWQARVLLRKKGPCCIAHVIYICRALM
jgi:hypothetical protein